MNLQNIISNIAAEDPEFYERTSDRRSTIRTFMKGAALTAVPFALGGLLKKAYGQAVSADIIGVLNFALTLEYLEAEFYNTAIGNASGIGIPQGAALTAINVIAAHENAHVAFLKTAIAGAGGTPAAKPTFDLTGGVGTNVGNGPFKAALQSDYNLFLAQAQVFEDTGVRAYKGGAPVLIPNNAILTAALQIHSVEARHAAHIRYMRARTTSPLVDGTVKSWITGNKSGINGGALNPAINKSYAGEEITTQAGVNIAGFVSSDSASESFDEPLTVAQVLDIVKIFIV